MTRRRCVETIALLVDGCTVRSVTATNPLPNLGTQQSPIALEDVFDAELEVSVGWKSLVLTPVDDGYSPTRKMSVHARGGNLRVGKHRYVPIDLHWHFPAEHVLGRRHKRYPSEVHIVHVHRDDLAYAQQGKLDWCRIVVLGVLLRSSREPYAPMTVAAEAEPGGKGVVVERDAILPAEGRAVRYDGSLTTPPYSENVTFVIFEEPMSATKAQLDDGGLPNARALQACNRRYCLRGHVATK